MTTTDLAAPDAPFVLHVLDTAVQLFSRHGTTGVSLDAVAAAAGVDPDDLRRVFPTRLDLVYRLVVDRVRLLTAAEPANTAPASPVEQMRRLVRRHIEHSCRYRVELTLRRSLLRTLRAISPPRYRELSLLLRAYHDRIARIIDQGRTDGVFTPADGSGEPVTATTVLDTLDSTLNWYDPSIMTPQQLGDVYEDLVLHHLLGVARR